MGTIKISHELPSYGIFFFEIENVIQCLKHGNCRRVLETDDRVIILTIKPFS